MVSGIDTTEAIVVAQQKRQAGKNVWGVPYDYIGACEGGDEVCLGVPYFNWGPGYLDMIKSAMDGKWDSKWEWLGPDWADINNPDTSSVGFAPGPALSGDVKKALDQFIADLGGGNLQLFKGPLNYQADRT